MTGPKLNEKNRVAGTRSGTKASAKYLRVSAYKAREVLDLIRGLPVRIADETLQFTDRHVSDDIRKVLSSAVANAVNNDEQDAGELYVKACFADEGPTLKRFAARARGRGTRILKRTCHITIVVDRLEDERLEVVQAREAKRTAAGRRRGAAAGGAAGRRARVERSRQRAAAAKGGPGDATTNAPADAVTDADHGSAESSAETTAQSFAGIAAAGDKPTFAGAIEAVEDQDPPEGYTVKGNAQSMLYHTTDSPYYSRTKAEYWFQSAEDAEAAGFSLPPSLQHDDAADEENK